MPAKAPLATVLAITTTKIKLIRNHQLDCLLTPDAALALILRFPQRYDWDGSKTRVKSLIDRHSTEPRPWTGQREECWRSTGAACLPPSIEYMNSRRSGKVGE